MQLNIENSYTIAFAVRSGSNQICRLLTRHGLGRPDEWFQTVPEFHDNPDAARDWLERIVEEKKAGGIFGSKMAHFHRARLDEALRAAMPGYAILDDVLPRHKWIWLKRRDKIAQAVSLYIAEDTTRWAQEKTHGNPSLECRYDYVGILSRLMILCANDVTWETYFSAHPLAPYEIWYEDFFADQERAFGKLAAYLGYSKPLPETVSTPDLAIQRDGQSEHFCARFREDLNRVGEEGFARDAGPAFARWNRFFFEKEWNNS